jgi:hypothetical protein
LDYKRSQVEDAIARLLEPGSAKPSSEMRTRLKRLLETDRGLGRKKRSGNPERANFAFYTTDAPGRGSDSRFSGYEAFALLTGLRLRQHGWPQRFAVTVLRHVRPELEKHHTRVLRQNPDELFDRRRILEQARPGDLFVDNTDPVFLATIARARKDHSGAVAAVCRGQPELMAFIRQQGPGQAWTTIELVNLAHALAYELEQTRPRKRGRGRG